MDITAKPKLTDWANEPSVEDLKNDLQNARDSYNEQITKINIWRDNFYIKGTAKLKLPKGKSSVQPSLIRNQAEWRYSALSEPFLSTTNLFAVRPISWEDRKAANQNNLLLNYQFQNKIDKVGFIDRYVRACVNDGTVIVKVGWVREEKEVETKVPVFEYTPVSSNMPQEEMEQVQQQLQQLAQLKEEAPDSYNIADDSAKEMLRVYETTQQLVYPKVVGYKTKKEIKAVVNQPTLKICDCKSVIIDPTCEGILEDASFVIHTFLSSKSELKKAGIYKNLNSIKFKNSMNEIDDTSFLNQSSFTFKDDARKKIQVYEYWGYWDIEGTGKTTPIVAAWAGDTLIRLEENPYPDGKIPFVIVPFMPLRNSVYGEPDGELLKDHQKIIGAVTRGMIDLLGKSANSQTGIAKGLLDAVNQAKYQQGQDYEYNPIGNPQTAIYQHKYPEIPNSALSIIQMTTNSAESLTGVKAFSNSGLSGASLGDTATGVRGVLDAASKREMGILRRLADGIVKIGRKVIAMNSEFLEEEEVIRVTNEHFVPIRKDDLAGNFDLKLTISTAEADEAKAQELAFMLQTMGNNIDLDMIKLILSEIARLRQMEDLAHQIENYQQQPSEFDQQMQQLQLQKAQAEVALLQAQAKEAATKGDMNEAKVEVEHARADNLQNEADNKTLDFQRKAQGIDLQHQQQIQASKNANNLAVADTAAKANVFSSVLKQKDNQGDLY